DPAPRGVPQIEVTFDIDANGILNVSAKDKGSGKEQKIVIKDSGGLSDEEIEKAKREAEQFAEADRKRAEIIETRNIADNAVYTVKKQMGELGDKLPAEAKDKVDSAVAAVEEALKGDDIDAIRSATDSLHQTFSELAASAQMGGGAEAGASAGEDEEDASGEPRQAKGKVVDADFEVVDEEKK
ncbi:MAG: Hsp70 family protein, partial [Verrucomicrobiae bacterium]|nr:Hsp70 family protein [Verrucomicrobiae bacterium]